MDERERRTQKHAGQSVRPAAELARLVVGASHTAELLASGTSYGTLPYLERDGTVVVLAPREQPLPTGRSGLRIVAPDRTEVVLMGHFGSFPLPAALACGVGAMLVTHRHCLTGHLDRHGATPRHLIADTVLVSRAEQAGSSAAAAEAVDLDQYARRVPDLFGYLGPALAAHLTASHQPLLIALAQEQGLAADPLAVRIRALRVREVELDVIQLDGSFPARIRFPTPLGHPHQLAAVLHGLAGARA